MAQNNQLIQDQIRVVDQRLLVIENATTNTTQILQNTQQQVHEIQQQNQQILDNQQVLLATCAANQGLTISQKNSIFKLLNKFVHYNGQLNVLFNDQGHQPPQGQFPQSKAELNFVFNVHQVNAILGFYGIPLNGNKTEKIFAFSQFIGVE